MCAFGHFVAFKEGLLGIPWTHDHVSLALKAY